MDPLVKAGVSMASVTTLTVFALAKVQGVGPLLLLVRLIDRVRAACECARLAWSAGCDEWRRMWPSCLARAKRHH